MGAWVFTPCTIVSALPSFWRTCCLHLLRDWIFSYGFVTKKKHIILQGVKTRKTFIWAKLGVKTRKKNIFLVPVAALKIPNPPTTVCGGENFRTRPHRPYGPPSLSSNGYRIPLPGVRRLGRGVDHPTPSSAKVKGRVEPHFYSTNEPSWHVLKRTLTFYP